ncbi:unnamed protein product [Amoebophrya sp. A120]|nr:unnamed protein product [Amoebophrya sp. A120]|eukprot:GSA120T00008045001.1
MFRSFVVSSALLVSSSVQQVLAQETTWPACMEQNTVIRNAGKALFTNVAGYGAAAGCFIDDCINTDKFAVSTLENCIAVCNSVPECNWWVFGEEEGMQKCWLRVADDGREEGEGWTSGAKSCQPVDTEKLILGNTECWMDGFDYDTCCDPKFGPNGNTQCWDGMFNFNRCCFPRMEL